MTQVRRMLDAGPGPQPASVDRLLDAVEAVGLRGRGGAGFPVARKLRTAAQARGRPVVVVNAAEGEPASGKDRALLTASPHLVLDGAQATARALGATEVVLATHDEAMLRAALRERPREVRTRLVRLAPGYVTSEASAVVSAAAGGPGLPTSRRAPQAQRGPGGRPWLVQNAETFACIGLLARYGVQRYREVGDPDEPGTLLLTLRGAVRHPGVVELPVGVPLASAVAAAGGLTEPVQALLVGGYAGRWLAGEALAAPLSQDGLRRVGGTLGAGLVVALPQSACGLTTTARLVRYLAGQSARQCGPCLNGLPALAGELEALAAGTLSSLDRIRRWCAQLPGRGACSHPDGAVALVASALAVFADDRHEGRSCGRPALELPT